MTKEHPNKRNKKGWHNPKNFLVLQREERTEAEICQIEAALERKNKAAKAILKKK